MHSLKSHGRLLIITYWYNGGDLSSPLFSLCSKDCSLAPYTRAASGTLHRAIPSESGRKPWHHVEVPAIQVLGPDFKVEYEGLHLICFGCGKYGHRLEQCISGQRKELPSPANPPVPMDVSDGTLQKEGTHTTESPGNTNDSISNPPKNQETNSALNSESKDSEPDCNPNAFGPWMLAKKTQRRKLRNVSRLNDNGNSVRTNQMGSRFEVLGQEKQQEEGPIPSKKI
ncbi:hypothetical protein PIB30_083198 [Stylosanthes scabra]|uniref:CCHC-type domain-containing protein n=1 Tax=Stylosanthes scabra TaxID=79078 RepID=A0ABU6RSD1_9FABA|nr:hypothetical protein [Stylosanthes scabra]